MLPQKLCTMFAFSVVAASTTQAQGLVSGRALLPNSTRPLA
ncbi:MAG: hypothetical protein ACKVS7_07665 [Gemmatimonadaceae bacterium]